MSVKMSAMEKAEVQKLVLMVCKLPVAEDVLQCSERLYPAN